MRYKIENQDARAELEYNNSVSTDASTSENNKF